jgi:membrane protein YqaA with SNARE-associated domain
MARFLAENFYFELFRAIAATLGTLLGNVVNYWLTEAAILRLRTKMLLYTQDRLRKNRPLLEVTLVDGYIVVKVRSRF